MIKKKKRGWFRNGGEAKRGYYKGVWVDSSWELAFLIYHLDKGNEIIRNTKNFPYKWRQGIQYYRPDFIVDGQYVEIKGYLDYAKAKFGEDFADKLLKGEK